MPQAATAHDTFWDFVSLMPESTHMLMWADVGPRHPAQLPDDAGLRRAHVPAGQRSGRIAVFVKFHWQPKLGTHSLVWDEAVKISGADPDFHRRDLWEAIEAGDYPGVGARPADLHRRAGRAVQLRRARCDQARPGGAGAGAARRAHGAEPQSRQLLRRDRAGRLLHGAHRARHRFHATIRCWQAASTRTSTRRSSRLGGPNFHEIADQRADRAGAQQPARRHAPAGDPSRSRRLRAELAGGWLSVPGRRRPGLHERGAAARRQGERRQGSHQAREIRRSLHPGPPLFREPDPLWRRHISAMPSGSSFPR